MSQKNIYKPRYTIAYIAKSKVWPYKNSYLRRFYALRARRLRRGGLFSRCVLVATTMKWTQTRRFIRPFQQSAGSVSVSTSSKTAFGRPRKRRYRDSFYMKQQLRAFHGKMKEEVLRHFFRTHQSTVGSRTQAFFSVLESRLDRFFFRRRVFPTVFSCHQFIHHCGLEVNGRIEQSPRAIIRVGDRVALPTQAWKSFYWDLFCRIYYRRWGLYVRRRRLYTQLKKYTYVLRGRSKSLLTNTRSKIGKGNYLVASRQHRDSFNNRFRALAHPQVFSSKKSMNLRSSGTANSIWSKAFFTNFLDFEQSVPKANTSIDISKYKGQHKLLYRFTSRLAEYAFSGQGESNSQDDKSIELSFSKLQQFQKLYFSLRLRKSLLPLITRYRKKRQGRSRGKVTKFVGQSSIYRRSYRRSNLLRLYRKRNKKLIRRNKRPRLKPIHFFIPSYMQMDFRTLRAVKIQSPSFEDIYYPFRISLSSVHSFYRTKGI